MQIFEAELEKARFSQRLTLSKNAQTGDAEELQAKLQALNSLIESEQLPLHHQSRAPFNHSGISEDSDYTSDVSFPIHHQPNSSVHQFESHLHPHRQSSVTTPTGQGLRPLGASGVGPPALTGTVSSSASHQQVTASYEDEEDAYRHQNEHHYDAYGDYIDNGYDRYPVDDHASGSRISGSDYYSSHVTHIDDYDIPPSCSSHYFNDATVPEQQQQQQFDSNGYLPSSRYRSSVDRYDSVEGPADSSEYPSTVEERRCGSGAKNYDSDRYQSDGSRVRPRQGGGYSSQNSQHWYTEEEEMPTPSGDPQRHYDSGSHGYNNTWSEHEPLSYNSRPRPDSGVRTSTYSHEVPTSHYHNDEDDLHGGGTMVEMDDPYPAHTSTANDFRYSIDGYVVETATIPNGHLANGDVIHEQHVDFNVPEVVVEEKRDFRELWRWSYKEVCKGMGIKVG
ncbi:hypothetical protein L596_026542 [Steinernema carpocapsae]|uniref:Uncharacterized protein n=1 Tax=Steinernema carpocapsae TaxID=34508 RepID=A0A4U5M1U3_STECR|nr:hypothetical protein L596_026542 [Steinernema carpocapsae]